MTLLSVRWVLTLPVLLALLGACSNPAKQVVEVRIDMRGEMAAGRFVASRDQVGVRGAVAPLSWMQTLLAQPSAQTGIYAVALQFAGAVANAQPVPYKFKVEDPDRPDAGWEPGRNRTLVLTAGAQPQILQRAFGVETDPPPVRRVGTIERLAPQPSVLVSPREVQVWLPPGYAQQPGRRYPVLYLHDGQNLFDAQAAGAEWQVDETAQRLVQAGVVAPMIVVAVASGEERIADYTPVATPPGGEGPPGGMASRYGRYLVEELKPFIDQHYRSLPDRASTAVGGSSLGGLVSMWLVLRQPQTFGAALVVSPSVWWADSAILMDSAWQNWDRTLAPPRVWLDVGLREGDGMVTGARALHQTLAQRGWPVTYLEQPDGGHDEASWAQRVEPMLRWLYGDIS